MISTDLRPSTPECTHLSPAYIYDANGYKRWCIDCGTELTKVDEEASWVQGGADVPHWAIALAVIVLALILGMLLIVMGVLVSPSESSGPRVTPTTYGYPSVVHSTP